MNATPPGDSRDSASPPLALPGVCATLFFAGMTLSMHFSSMATLAFANIDAVRRPGATTLAAMAQQVGSALGVAVAALALELLKSNRAGAALNLADFQHALFAAGALMAIAVLWSQRLPRNAGTNLRHPQ